MKYFLGKEMFHVAFLFGWIAGFNPEFDKPNCNDMVIIGSIDFVGREELYEALRDKIYAEEKNNYFVFDEDKHTVWIIWNKKENY